MEKFKLNHAVTYFSLACRCAAKAKELNYKIFGLQNFAECWSGPGAEKEYARDGASKDCYNNPCDVSNPRECVGGPGSNYVYELIEGTSSIMNSYEKPTLNDIKGMKSKIF